MRHEGEGLSLCNRLKQATTLLSEKRKDTLFRIDDMSLTDSVFGFYSNLPVKDPVIEILPDF